jgi:hypothetical protein
MSIFRFFLFVFMLLSSLSLSCAGLTFYTKIMTEITIFLDNGSSKKVLVKPAQPVAINGWFAGFEKIEWTDPFSGDIYRVILNIKGRQGWFDIFIKGGGIAMKDKTSGMISHMNAIFLGSIYAKNRHTLT